MKILPYCIHQGFDGVLHIFRLVSENQIFVKTLNGLKLAENFKFKKESHFIRCKVDEKAGNRTLSFLSPEPFAW
jgi:hypothetical protein